jgi:NTP pyrophosphatase (non-canonical NTP hydrolase)
VTGPDRAREQLLAEVEAERRRQDEIWGIQRHAPEAWLTILTAELGELAEAVLKAEREGRREWWASYRHGLIQLAAVALAAAERFDDTLAHTEPPSDGQ